MSSRRRAVGRGDVAHHERLGDLERQQRGLDPGLLQSPLNVGEEPVAVELLGRDLDRHADPMPRHVPGRGAAAGLLQGEAADRHDQAGFLGQRDEVRRGEDALLGMAPADQRLEADDAAAAEVVDRLVEQEELTLGERRVQLGLEHGAALDDRAHVRVEQRVSILSGGLGGDERQLCVAQQVVGGGVATEGDADAGGEDEARAEAVELDRFVQRLDHSLGERVQAHAAGRRFDEHDELVAVEPAHGVSRAHHFEQPFADDPQQLVAGGRSELVVDLVQLVDVDEQRAREHPRVATRARDHPLGAIERERAVGQAGERLVEVLSGQLLRTLVLGLRRRGAATSADVSSAGRWEPRLKTSRPSSALSRVPATSSASASSSVSTLGTLADAKLVAVHPSCRSIAVLCAPEAGAPAANARCEEATAVQFAEGPW